MKRHTHVKLHPGALEEVLPHMTSKDRIPITDDRPREAVEPDYSLEERLGD
jgi:hypothetical protein